MRNEKHLILSFVATFLSFWFLSCTHRGVQANGVSSQENIRLARAQVTSIDGVPVKGLIDFEQMPNSVIVVFRLEGLESKKPYQILVQERQGCESTDFESSNLLFKMRANRSGIAENTFKVEEFSVSGNRSLVGNFVLVASRPTEKDGRLPEILACGQIQPLHPSQALNR